MRHQINDWWAVWGKKLSSTVIREGIDPVIREGIDPFIAIEENKPFVREIMKLRKLGSIKSLSIENKVNPLKWLNKFIIIILLGLGISLSVDFNM